MYKYISDHHADNFLIITVLSTTKYRYGDVIIRAYYEGFGLVREDMEGFSKDMILKLRFAGRTD